MSAAIIPFPSRPVRQEDARVSVPAKPPVLNTDADFLAAEREVLRLLHEFNTLPGIPDEYSDVWNQIDRAIGETLPRTLVQAAVKLRRLTCQYNGVEASWSVHVASLRLIEGYLSDLVARTSRA